MKRRSTDFDYSLVREWSSSCRLKKQKSNNKMEKFYQKGNFKFAAGIVVGILLYKILMEVIFK